MKKIITILYLLLIVNLLFALPAVTATLPDASGEYVYYRDNSFKRESYVGFLYYNESTYQVRYFAPAVDNEPVKILEIIFSIDSNANHLELTGERFITPPQQDDTEVVNYIHDLLYELTARRIKLGELELTDYSKNKADFLDAGKRVYDTYEQFGGDVTIIYDALVPIFNIKKIIDYKGSDVFTVVTTGRLASSNDTGFSEFVPPSMAKSSKKAAQIKSAKKASISYTVQMNEKQNFKQEIQADKNWSQENDNMWVLGDNAFIFLSGFKFPQEIVSQGSDFVTAQILRRYIASNGYAYSDWNALNVFVEKDKIKINAKTYNPKTGNTLTDIKTFGRVAANFYGCFSFTAFTDGYQKNRGYYDKLIKSYSFSVGSSRQQ